MVKADNAALKKWKLYCLIAFVVIYFINCFVLSPLNTRVTTDVLYADTALPILVGYVYEILELAVISFLYAVLLMTLYEYGTSKTAGIFVIFSIMTLCKYAANTILTWIREGKLPYLWGWDVANVFFYSLLELLQLFIIYLIAKRIITAHTDKKLVITRALKKTGKTEKDIEDVSNLKETVKEAYPFESIFDMNNCLLKSAFFCGVVTLVAKLLIGALLSDIWLILLDGFPKESSTWVMMIINYLAKVVLSVMSYFIVFIGMSYIGRDIK